MRESEVFLMRNTKRELNPYSFYDTEGLARHFERMAAEGWAPDRVGLFIRYRRIKPQKLRFAITYYPDDGDADGEDVFLEYCAQAGWQQSAGVGDLTFWGDGAEGEGGGLGGRTRHVLCTADENAVDVETDPVLQVDAMHRGLKPYCHWLVAFSILLITQLDTIADGLRRDPFSGIASGARLVMLGLWMILIVICLSQCIGYYRWYGKAKQIAAKEGRFLRPKSRPWLQTLWRLILLLTIFSAVVVILMGNDTSGQARLYYVTLLIVCGPIAAAFFAYSSMERAGAKRGERCVITALVMVLTVAAVAGLSYTMKQNGLFEDGNANAEWYSENGAHFTIYHDPLLLYLSDLGVEDGGARWSCRSWEVSSPLGAQRSGRQEDALCYPDPNEPRQYHGVTTNMCYVVSDVYAESLFALCLAAQLDYQKRYSWSDAVYREVDAKPWGADRAWQAFDTESDGWGVSWVLTRGKRIVRIGGSALTGTLSQAQMDTIGEKLLSADIK